jgi:UDP-N-acetyl-D-mannosaminuronic acid dehydrogenase
VLCTDPYVPGEDFVSLDEAILRADIIVLGAPHSVYRGVNIPQNKEIVDVWGFWQPQSAGVESRAIAVGEAFSTL